jgi:hypothetical protein
MCSASATSDDQCQDRLLARRQGGEALSEHCDQRLVLPVQPISLDGGLDRIQEVLLAEGLGQEFHRAGLHCPHRHRDVAVTGQEDDRQIDVRCIQLLLKIKAAFAGQAHIEHETARTLRPSVFEEFLGRGKHPDA